MKIRVLGVTDLGNRKSILNVNTRQIVLTNSLDQRLRYE